MSANALAVVHKLSFKSLLSHQPQNGRILKRLGLSRKLLDSDQAWVAACCANESLHTQAENNAARQRCRQLIDGGVAAVDWLDLYGQK